jgi:glycosyltransferase involved in cell wall biosynthesis
MLTAILHTHNDALRIGRAIETLRPCDEVLVMDHASKDGTFEVAQQYGARVLRAAAQAADTNPFAQARHDWILCLLPTESLAEMVEAALFEWKEADPLPETTYSIPILQELPGGRWSKLDPTTRLIHRPHPAGRDGLPLHDVASHVLAGYLLRLLLP